VEDDTRLRARRIMDKECGYIRRLSMRLSCGRSWEKL
jgi:hypothetical protein